MKIKPVTVEVIPNYPDKYNDNIKHMLITKKPNRWVSTPLVGLLSAAVSFSLVGCSNKNNNSHETETPGIEITTPFIKPVEHILYGDVPGPYQHIFQGTYIPIFEFGDGTGGIGCMAITAPVFMSEEEAFEVISAAFAEAGLYFYEPTGYRVEVNLPVTNIDGDEIDPNKTVQGNLMPDGWLATHDLTIKFVSRFDVADWHEDIDDSPKISFSSFNIKQAAQTLAENNTAMVVFYDPVAGIIDYDITRGIEQEENESDEDFYARISAIMEEEHRKALAESELLLRQQVDAFIAWLFELG